MIRKLKVYWFCWWSSEGRLTCFCKAGIFGIAETTLGLLLTVIMLPPFGVVEGIFPILSVKLINYILALAGFSFLVYCVGVLNLITRVWGLNLFFGEGGKGRLLIIIGLGFLISISLAFFVYFVSSSYFFYLFIWSIFSEPFLVRSLCIMFTFGGIYFTDDAIF